MFPIKYSKLDIYIFYGSWDEFNHDTIITYINTGYDHSIIKDF